jgi:hypothetical protein
MKKLLLFLLLFSSSLLAQNAKVLCAISFTVITSASPPDLLGSWIDSSGPFDCGGHYTLSLSNKSKDALLLTRQSESWTDTCIHLKEFESLRPNDEAGYQVQYDTLKLYVETCAPSDCNAADAFGKLDAANQFRSNDTNRYSQYRKWLISILYLNKSCEDYFCSVIGAIQTTYQKTVEVLAIMNYMRTFHPNCWGAADQKQYSEDSITAKNSGHDPTHLPSLESLGLGFLLKNNIAPSASGIGTNYLSSFSSSPNPFTSETKLHFALNAKGSITIEVYDLLGKKVYGVAGKSYEAGSYEINLDGKDLPHGTLYARISTGFGEVKTVKLVHE